MWRSKAFSTSRGLILGLGLSLVNPAYGVASVGSLARFFDVLSHGRDLDRMQDLLPVGEGTFRLQAELERIVERGETTIELVDVNRQRTQAWTRQREPGSRFMPRYLDRVLNHPQQPFTFFGRTSTAPEIASRAMRLISATRRAETQQVPADVLNALVMIRSSAGRRGPLPTSQVQRLPRVHADAGLRFLRAQEGYAVRPADEVLLGRGRQLRQLWDFSRRQPEGVGLDMDSILALLDLRPTVVRTEESGSLYLEFALPSGFLNGAPFGKVQLQFEHESPEAILTVSRPGAFRDPLDSEGMLFEIGSAMVAAHQDLESGIVERIRPLRRPGADFLGASRFEDFSERSVRIRLDLEPSSGRGVRRFIDYLQDSNASHSSFLEGYIRDPQILDAAELIRDGRDHIDPQRLSFVTTMRQPRRGEAEIAEVAIRLDQRRIGRISIRKRSPRDSFCYFATHLQREYHGNNLGFTSYLVVLHEVMRYFQLDVVSDPTRLSPQARNLWERLLARGYARRVGQSGEQFEMRNDAAVRSALEHFTRNLRQQRRADPVPGLEAADGVNSEMPSIVR